MATDDTDGLSYTSVAINHLIPFVLPIIGDTWQIETGKAIYILRGVF